MENLKAVWSKQHHHYAYIEGTLSNSSKVYLLFCFVPSFRYETIHQFFDSVGNIVNQSEISSFDDMGS